MERKLDFNDYWIGSLLHDMGKIALGCFFWDYFKEIITIQSANGVDFRKAESLSSAVADHEYIGRLMILNARMTPAMAEAVGAHHDGGRNRRPLTCLVHLADNICKDLGLGYLPDERGDYSADVLRAMRLTPSGVQSLVESLGPSLRGGIEELAELCLP